MGLLRSAIVAAALLALPAAAAGQRHAITEAERVAAEAAVAGFTSPRLTRFASDAEFRRYVEALRTARLARGLWWAQAGGIRFAQAQPQADVQSDAADPVCPADDPACTGAGEGESVMVTGSRIAPRNPSVTNNQMRGVEEGDIVKQIDHYLLVLQDGRLFVIDIEARGRRALALVDRANVYRNPEADTWYDEMLVRGDRVLVLGYSYDEGMSEVAVFRLGAGGRLTNEGIFHLTSGDYYSTTNYATRLIGDSLVIYTPFEIGGRGGRAFDFPVVRRWIPNETRDDARRRGRPIIDAASIYRPVRAPETPTIHSVSVCPLGPIGPGADFECRTTGFVGPQPLQWYVTGDDVFLWTRDDDADHADEDCGADLRFAPARAQPALLYRVPVDGGAPTLAAARGMPPDQFALDAGAGRFHALLQWRPQDCHDDWATPARLVYLNIPLAALSDTLAELPAAAYTPLPSTGSRWTVNRFTGRYLVYGGLSRFRRGLPDLGRYRREGYDEDDLRRLRAELSLPPAYVLPVDRPEAVRSLQVRQTVIRAEQAGNDVVLTGYRDRGGLFVTLIDLDGPPAIASSVRLPGRYESEGRSHAFNSLIEPDGSGLMGLPTVRRIADSDRNYWRSRASDMSFLEVDVRGQLAPLGELERRFRYVEEDDEGEEDEDGVPGYECEVSCIDWYGNSRPIFTGGRIFALSGTELIEGRLAEGRIQEIQRLNIALESTRR